MERKPKAVVLLSGGLDSTTVLAIANASGYDSYALSFSYGQRHSWELECARSVASALRAKEHRIASIDLRVFGGSALTAGTVPLCTCLRCPTEKHFSQRRRTSFVTPSKLPISVEPDGGSGLLLLRHVTPLPRRDVVYFYSGAHTSYLAVCLFLHKRTFSNNCLHSASIACTLRPFHATR
jgi:hypothetical protein